MMLQAAENRDAPPPLIVITRPEEQARPLAATLAARGYATLVEPMLEIVPLKPGLPPLDAYAALAFTSANGVRAFAELTPERGVPAYAVGEATAAALRALGFRAIRAASGDARELATLIRATIGNGGRVLHVAGRAVARDLGELLAPAEIAVDTAALYDAVQARSLSKALVSALYARTVSGVLFLSARTAGAFGTLVNESGYASMVTSSTAICLSEAVASVARQLAWGSILVAERPTVDLLLALLPTLSGTKHDGD